MVGGWGGGKQLAVIFPRNLIFFSFGKFWGFEVGHGVHGLVTKSDNLFKNIIPQNTNFAIHRYQARIVEISLGWGKKFVENSGGSRSMSSIFL